MCVFALRPSMATVPRKAHKKRNKLFIAMDNLISCDNSAAFSSFFLISSLLKRIIWIQGQARKHFELLGMKFQLHRKIRAEEMRCQVNERVELDVAKSSKS